MARFDTRPIAAVMSWDETNKLTAGDLIEFVNYLRKARVAADAEVKLDWEMVDRRETYKMSV